MLGTQRSNEAARHTGIFQKKSQNIHTAVNKKNGCHADITPQAAVCVCVCVLSGKYCIGLEVQCCNQMGDKTLSPATFTANHHQRSVCIYTHTNSPLYTHTHRGSNILNHLRHTYPSSTNRIHVFFFFNLFSILQSIAMCVTSHPAWSNQTSTTELNQPRTKSTNVHTAIMRNEWEKKQKDRKKTEWSRESKKEVRKERKSKKREKKMSCSYLTASVI